MTQVFGNRLGDAAPPFSSSEENQGGPFSPYKVTMTTLKFVVLKLSEGTVSCPNE